MAWGMFCWIPCPYKQWREEDRLAQIGMFPLVGTMIGLILCAAWFLLSFANLGLVLGALLTGGYFLLTGFIHLDGFMDCSDAIMPRHPDMETRRRILKDSHSGAFALICLVLMTLVFWTSMMDITSEFSIKVCCTLVVIFNTSRFTSAIMVLTQAPMSTSQYAGQAGMQRPSGKNTIPAFVIMLVVLAAAELVISGGNLHALIYEPYSNVAFIVVVVTAWITAKSDIKKLGGMSGDISGHMITMSEMFGLVAAAILF